MPDKGEIPEASLQASGRVPTASGTNTHVLPGGPVEAAARWVRAHPLAAVGISLGVGAAVGFLFSALLGRKDRPADDETQQTRGKPV